MHYIYKSHVRALLLSASLEVVVLWAHHLKERIILGRELVLSYNCNIVLDLIFIGCLIGLQEDLRGLLSPHKVVIKGMHRFCSCWPSYKFHGFFQIPCLKLIKRLLLRYLVLDVDLSVVAETLIYVSDFLFLLYLPLKRPHYHLICVKYVDDEHGET